MQIRTLDIEGLLEITPKQFGDDRGYFAETFRDDMFSNVAGPVRFVQENQSLSLAAGTIRGIHFQTDPFAQGKLVRCIAGRIFDVAVDLRTGSPSYGRWTAVVLSADAANQLWIPAGFGHAFCTLEPGCIVSYKVTAYYSAANDKGVCWNDPAIGIRWPSVANAETLSAKDRIQPMLTALGDCFPLKSKPCA